MKRFIWFIFGFIAGISYLFTFLTGWLFGFGFKNNGSKPRTYSDFMDKERFDHE